MIAHCTWHSVHAQTAKHVVVLNHCFPIINPCDILQKWIIERELVNKDESAAKKQKEQKVMMLEVKIKCSINEVTEEIAHSGNVDTVAIQETLEMKLEGHSEGKIIDINVEMLRLKRWRYPRTSDASKNLHIKGNLRDIWQH